MFQPIPQLQPGVPLHTGHKDEGSVNTNYYFASYGHGQSSGKTSGVAGKKRIDKVKLTGTESLTPKQAIMIAAMQPKSSGKMSVNTGHSSKGSTHSKIPSSQQRNEYLSTQQTKNQYGGQFATNRSHQTTNKEQKMAA